MRIQMRPLLWASAVLALLCSTTLVSAYYDPGVQRWITRDPIVESGFRNARHRHPLPPRVEANVYAYVGCNPLTRYDPLGLIHQEETDIQSCLDNCLDDRNNQALGAIGKACKHHAWGHIIGGAGTAVAGLIAGVQHFQNLIADLVAMGFGVFEAYEIAATVADGNMIKANAQKVFVACCNGCGAKYKDAGEARQYTKDHPLK